MASCIATATAVREAILAGQANLLTSLQQLCTLDQASAIHPLAESLQQRLLQEPRCPLSPWVFLGYYAIGSQLLNQHEEPLSTLPLELIQAEIERCDPAGSVIPFGDPRRAPAKLWQLMLEHFQQGGDFVSDLEPPDAEITTHTQQAIGDARQLIQQVDPELLQLMDQLQRLVILGHPGEQSRQRGENFGGATCFFFRGACVLNTSHRDGVVTMTEQLVHEYAHAELFVLGQDEPLCLNTDEERHSISIRSDPRPMNGILHSLWVVARVTELIKRILATDLRPYPDHDSLQKGYRKSLARNLDFGRSSLQAVHHHARLTPLGEAIVDLAVERLAVATSQP